MKKSPKMLFVVRSYIWAKDAKEALNLATKTAPQECWVDEKWKERQDNPRDAIGFDI